ncbi:MAG: tetratricopeptide repeat protein, partial [Bacteroidota bacterium]
MQTFVHAQDMRDFLIRADDAFSKKDYETSLKLYRDVHDSRTPDKTDTVYVNAVYGMIFSLSNIGLDLQSSGNYFYADIYYNKAIQLLDNSAFSDNTMKAYLYHLIGKNFGMSGSNENAVEMYEKALQLNEGGDPKKFCDFLTDLAKEYSLLGRKEKSDELFRKTITYYEKERNKYKYELASTYLMFGFVRMNDGAFDESENLFLQ